MKKLSRSERKYWYRRFSRAKLKIEKYAFANIFSEPMREEQKTSYRNAVKVWSEARKRLSISTKL